MMRNIFGGTFGGGFIATLLIASPAFAQKAPAPTTAAQQEVVATVGGKNITLKDFNEKYDDVQKQTVNPPTKELFLEDLVRYEMGVQEAEKRGLAQDPIVKERVRQELYKGLLEKDIGAKIKDIKVNENEMKAYYQRNPELRTSHILIEFKPEATDQQKQAAKQRAQEIYAEVQKSKRPFEELVALYTDDVLSKKNGGDIGWQTGLTIVPPYYDAALRMKVGEVKGLVETPFGYHIIKLTGRHAYADADKRKMRAAVFDEKRKVIFDDYFARLKKQYPVHINKSALK
jgi:parvulin-like peptidyl-prolyl isomerase